MRLIVCNLDFEIRNMSALVSRNISSAGSFFGGFCCFCWWVAVRANLKGLTKNKTPFLRAFLFWRSIFCTMPELKPSYSISWVDWLMAEHLSAQGQAGSKGRAPFFAGVQTRLESLLLAHWTY